MKYLKKYEKLIFAIFLIVVNLVYFGVYWNRILPYSEGWGLAYVDLMSSGKVPYRDFYFYLPPLNLLVDTVFWKLSFGYMIVYRMWRILERLVIELILYHLLCKIVKPSTACISAFLGIVLTAATHFDLLGDYNQTCDLLVLLLIWAVIKYAENLKQGCEKKEYFYLGLSGICIGLAFLHKQTIFVAEVILFFCFLTYVFWANKKKNYIKSVAVTFFSALAPVAIWVIWLLLTQSFMPFIEQVYMSTNSKGTIIDILSTPFNQLNDFSMWVIAETIILALLCLARVGKTKDSSKNNVLQGIVLYLFLASVIHFYYGARISALISTVCHSKKAAILLVLPIIYLVISYVYCKLKKKDVFLFNDATPITLLCIVLAILLVKENTGIAIEVYGHIQAFSLVELLPYYAAIVGIIYYAYTLYKYKVNQDEQLLFQLIIMTGGLVSSYAIMMGCGSGGLNNRANMILFPVLFAIFLDRQVFGNRVKNAVLMIGAILLCIICLSQKIERAYAWWGWNETRITEEDKHEINVPGLEGFRVRYDTKMMYEAAYEVISSNIDSDSVIYGYPHIEIFNVLCKNSNMSTFVPVPFYDVCSQEAVEQDAKRLAENPPDIIVWCDIPGCIDLHESVYNGGQPLAQREIMEWFYEARENNEYVSIGQYGSLSVYKLNDGS